MMKEIDIFNDESLQNDIQDLAVIEQAMIREKYPLPDLDAELEKIVGKESPTYSGSSLSSSIEEKKPVLLRTLVSAAIGAAAMLALILAWQWMKQGVWLQAPNAGGQIAQNAPSASGLATIQTASGEMITLTLADGTEVKLNSNSKITYPHQFAGQERMVHLEGEAYFKVRHDAQRPFVVEAGGVLTKDLGTSFNIKASSQDACQITLVEGKVEVKAKGSRKPSVALQPGQQYSYSSQAKSVVVKKVNTDETTAWAEGLLYYHDQTLERVVADLAARYRMKAVFKNEKAKAKHLDFSADKNGTPNEAVELLNNLGVAEVSVKGNSIVVE